MWTEEGAAPVRVGPAPSGGHGYSGGWIEAVLRYAPLVVLIAAIAVYANSIANGFAYDDDWIIVQNARVHDLTDLRSIWLTPYWPSFGDMLGLYRPLTIFGFAVQWALVGDAPWLFHLTNTLLHAAVSVAGLHLLKELVPRSAALVGALVFAVHPIHTEAVANVVGQAELTAALLVLVACIVWVRRPGGVTPGPRTTVVMAALYAIALLAKEHAIVLPGLLVALDAARGRLAIRPWLRPMAWMFVVAVGYLVLRLHVLGSFGGSDPGPALPYLRGDMRLLTALRAWPEFLRLMIWPADLSADYSPGVVLPAASVTPMVALGGVLLAVTVALALLTPRLPRAGLPAAWFLVSILPVSNLFFPIGVLLAERTLYLPSFALALAAAFLWQSLGESARETGRVRRFEVGVAPAVLLLAALALMSVRTVQRNPDWKDVRAVMDALIRDHPESYRAQWSAAVFAAEAGHVQAAEDHWTLAYALWPRDPQMLMELGAHEISRNRPNRAVDLLSTARRLVPEHPRPAMLLPLALERADRPQEALRAIDDAYPLFGPDSRLFELKARIHARIGEHAEAAGAWHAVIRGLRGGNAEQWRLMGQELALAGDRPAGAAALDTAVARARAAMDPAGGSDVLPLPLALPAEAVLDSIAATRGRLGL